MYVTPEKMFSTTKQMQGYFSDYCQILDGCFFSKTQGEMAIYLLLNWGIPNFSLLTVP